MYQAGTAKKYFTVKLLFVDCVLCAILFLNRSLKYQLFHLNKGYLITFLTVCLHKSIFLNTGIKYSEKVIFKLFNLRGGGGEGGITFSQ